MQTNQTSQASLETIKSALKDAYSYGIRVIEIELWQQNGSIRNSNFKFYFSYELDYPQPRKYVDSKYSEPEFKTIVCDYILSGLYDGQFLIYVFESGDFAVVKSAEIYESGTIINDFPVENYEIVQTSETLSTHNIELLVGFFTNDESDKSTQSIIATAVGKTVAEISTAFNKQIDKQLNSQVAVVPLSPKEVIEHALFLEQLRLFRDLNQIVKSYFGESAKSFIVYYDFWNNCEYRTLRINVFSQLIDALSYVNDSVIANDNELLIEEINFELVEGSIYKSARSSAVKTIESYKKYDTVGDDDLENKFNERIHQFGSIENWIKDLTCNFIVDSFYEDVENLQPDLVIVSESSELYRFNVDIPPVPKYDVLYGLVNASIVSVIE